MTLNAVFDRVSSLVEEIGQEKQAAAQDAGTIKKGMDDPGGHEGASSHPSTKGDDDELPQPAPEGEQSSDNSSTLKEQTPNVPDGDPELTPEAAPKQDEVQLGQGVDAAKPTGEDPSVEQDYKGDKEDPPEQGNKDMGGTTHPATGDHGEKYSSLTRDSVGALASDELCKVAADIGSELTADIANGIFAGGSEKQAMRTLKHCPTCNKDYSGDSCPCGYDVNKGDGVKTATDANGAAQAGYDAAAQLSQPDEAEKFAANVISQTVKQAHFQADLIADHLARTKFRLSKVAEEEMSDPTGGGAQGEAHGSEDRPPEEGGGGEDLLAAMAGGGGGEPPAPGPEGPPEGGLGGPPPELGGMGEQDAVQQLAMALLELGIDPAELAAAAGGGEMGGPPPGAEMGGPPPGAEMGGPPPEMGPGPKLAYAVQMHKAAGHFKVTEAKEGSAERKVRDYMKSYVHELVARSAA